MKNKLVTLLATIGCLSTATFSYGWGTWAHDHINKGAILALPPEMGMFFYNHADFIVTESTSPDIRKHLFSDKAEASRHYIDLERYTTGTGPMPKTLKDAYARWGKDTVETYGSLPWTIEDMMTKLTDAFRKKQKSEILFIAANMGHYIADAHMPLHTTLNHNGQLTGQVGIHPFWEGQLPELFGKDYNLNAGDAHYISNIDKATWNIMDTSFSLVYPLLHTESNMRRDNPEDKQYVMGADGKPLRNVYAQPVHTYEYAHVYHELLGGMVEQQMRYAIKYIADFWYTAWVNAGKPDLTDLDPDYVTEANKPLYAADMKAWKKGKVRGCSSDKEFPR